MTTIPSGSAPNAGERTVNGCCPLDCPDACAWTVTVDVEGRARRLRGRPDHPFTRGGLCPKVNPWLDYAADPDRLLHPLRRTGPKGSGRFERISWDQALTEIAERFRTTIDRAGPAAIWPFAGTGNVGQLQGWAGHRLWNRLGTSGHLLSICSIAGHVGLSYTTGTAAGVDPDEVVEAGIVLIWGSNTLVANRHWWPFVEEARRRGAPVVVIDPIRTRTAERADLHVAPLPGTDGALALGLAAALADRGALDDDFLSDGTLGADEFLASLPPWTLERTASITGVAVADLERLVELLAERGPLFVKLGQGMQRHAGGGQAARTVSCLPALLGAYGRPGGGLVYSTSDVYRLNRRAADLPSPGGPPRTLVMTRLADTLAESDDPPVEILWITGANPVVSNPDTDRVRAQLARDDLFTVVVELFPTETAAHADLVLPSTMQHEHHELQDSFSHCYLNANEAAVAPPGECLSHTEIYRRLALALGFDDPELQASDDELMAALLSSPHYVDAGVTVDRLRAEGFVRVPGTDPWRPFAERFPTASGRFEFVSERAERDGHGRLPGWFPPREAGPADDGSLRLLAPAGEHHVNSVFAGTTRVRGATSRPPLRVHPDDAGDLVDGSTVRVHNDRGSFEAELRLDPGVRRGLAVTTKGWWNHGVNATVAERDADLGAGAVYHDNRVFLSPIEPAADQ